MMRLSESLIELIEQRIKKGYISKRKHPRFNIYNLNYTAKTQNEWLWDEATKRCRGLIVDDEYNIVARSYYKFFSYEQIEDKSEIPVHLTAVVQDKVDGNLGILFYYENEWVISSRGSFESDHAIEGMRVFKEKYSHIDLDTEYTYVVEMILTKLPVLIKYPEDKLVLHGIFRRDTTAEVFLEHFHDLTYLRSVGFPIVDTFEIDTQFNGFDELTKKYPYDEMREGFVVRFSDGYRVKLKYDEYKKLAYLRDAVTNSKLLTMIKEGSLNDSLDAMPQNVVTQINTFTTIVDDMYESILSDHVSYLKSLIVTDKKDIAREILSANALNSSLLFALYDMKESRITKLIWDEILKRESELDSVKVSVL